MAEEHGFWASKGHRLCLNNCGLVGSSATQNFCSKCYNDLFRNIKVKPTSTTKPVPVFFLPSSLTSSSSSPACFPVPEVSLQLLTNPNRCSACRKKVGLTGFRCRCGITFCGTHRYPEHHGCAFDYKTIGREAIGKANPLIKAEKLEKI